jgi:hypothetical protein
VVVSFSVLNVYSVSIRLLTKSAWGFRTPQVRTSCEPAADGLHMYPYTTLPVPGMFG